MTFMGLIRPVAAHFPDAGFPVLIRIPTKLELAWQFRTDSFGDRVDGILQSTPLVAKGRLLSSAGPQRDVVCLNATVEILWMHRDDMDVPCAAILCDIPHEGKIVKALAQPAKQAFLYVLNRETGEPPGGSCDPETHIVYVYSKTVIDASGFGRNANQNSDFATVGPEFLWRDTRDRRGRRRRRFTVDDALDAPVQRGVLSVAGLPLNKPPYGKATEQKTGAVFMPAQQTGAAMTYMQGGRQCIVCAIGGTGTAGPSLIAFRLPAST
jgi:hypothetical protein